MKQIACIVGARPNFMKMAPILRALEQYSDVQTLLIHTGQHYDALLSDVFFQELGIRAPDVSLGVGSGSHATQTAKLLTGLEKTFLDAPDGAGSWSGVVVVGDVNSTMAAALTAAKLHIPIAHVEAGLRSFDRRMPEEINRLVTDSISDLLLVSEPAGVENLKGEGHSEEKIFLVGNVMIDTLLQQVDRARTRKLLPDLSLTPGQYCVVTLHRPSNVDHLSVLEGLVQVLEDVSKDLPVVFPVHPRTRGRLDESGLTARLEAAPDIRLLEPQGYNDFLCLTSQAKVIVTDSGGLQEESTALGVPCLTMRENTERPVTVEEGTSTLCGSDARMLSSCLNDIIHGRYKSGRCPDLWDGHAAVRIAEQIVASW